MWTLERDRDHRSEASEDVRLSLWPAQGKAHLEGNELFGVPSCRDWQFEEVSASRQGQKLRQSKGPTALETDG